MTKDEEREVKAQHDRYMASLFEQGRFYERQIGANLLRALKRRPK